MPPGDDSAWLPEPALDASPVRASVLVVDDHALLRTGVANIINQERDLEVVAEAQDGQAAVEAYRQHRPDVTLMDLRMPVMEGVEAVRQIRALDPQARVVVLTTYDADEDIARALEAGAKAYILKDIAAEALVTCIRQVLAGRTYLAPAAAAKLAERVTQVQLTPRELTALRLMADGQSNKEIAQTLGISERTVKTHLGHLFEKLGVTSRTEAVRVGRGADWSGWTDAIPPGRELIAPSAGVCAGVAAAGDSLSARRREPPRTGERPRRPEGRDVDRGAHGSPRGVRPRA